MILFKYLEGSSPTDIIEGEMIRGYTSIMWVERYSDPGEFEIVGPVSSGLKEFLPLGTIIGYQKSYELMIVENCEINEDGESDPTLKITGRSFVSIMEQKVAGVGLTLDREDGSMDEYPLLSDVIELQIANLIDETMISSFSGGDNLSHVAVSAQVESSAIIGRTIKHQFLWNAVKGLMADLDIGIKTIRRNPFGFGSDTNTTIMLYYGVDRTEDVIFQWRAGELEQTQYLFSNKNRKTSCFVFGKWVFTVVDRTGGGYNRRMMMLDASDLDEQLDAAPTGPARDDIIAKMRERGRLAIKTQQGTEIAQADIANIRKYKYREDFNIGDIIRLQGNFGIITDMRITEYTEIEDQTGESSHPTLSLPGDTT